MLDKYFAQKFIDTIRKYVDYKFMVFNPEGIILAATEKERVGVFHEASYNMFRSKQEMIVVEPEDVKKYLGVKCGVDMTIVHDNTIVGGIGITGIPEQVMDVITMAKITIEAMLDYEMYKEQVKKKNSERDEFCSLLLKTEIKDTNKLYYMANRLYLNTEIPRLVIIFEVPEEGNNRKDTVSIISESTGFSNQDIVFLDKEQDIIICKSIQESDEGLFAEYKTQVQDFLMPICRKLHQRSIYFRYYVGSMQRKLENYRFSYNHCLWLRDVGLPRAFFYDYMNEYIQDQIPVLELYGVFHFIGSMLDEGMKKEFVEIVTALNSCNYNLVESSKKLHIHKNTLIFHLNKIRDMYHINPIQDGEDRAFTDYLCRYLKSLEAK